MLTISPQPLNIAKFYKKTVQRRNHLNAELVPETFLEQTPVDIVSVAWRLHLYVQAEAEPPFALDDSNEKAHRGIE